MSRIVMVLLIILLLLAAIIIGCLAVSSGTSSFFGGAASRRSAETDQAVKEMQREVAEHYAKYRAGPPVDFQTFCSPKGYSIQRQQAFVGDFMKPGTKHDSLLVFHKIGAGKTCAEIQVGEKWKERGRPLAVMPASLIPGFRDELRTECAGNTYLTDGERQRLRQLAPGSPDWSAIIAASDRRIDEAYQVMSYNRFAQLMAAGSPPAAPVLLVDEVQNVDNVNGTTFRALLEWVEANPRAPVVVMTATPVFDQPKELAGIGRLMRLKLPADVVAGERPLTPEEVERLFNGHVSYFAGAPAYTFPKVTVEIAEVPMSAFQARWYASEVKAERLKSGGIALQTAPNDFYIKSRQRANIVYPNGLAGDQGLAALTPALIRESLPVYSAKFARICRRLSGGDLSFVYSSFTGAGGIAAFTKCLRAFGWKDFQTAGPGRRRYAIWSGDQTGKEKGLIRSTFNSTANDGGGLIQVVVGSPSIKEGVSLLRVRQVHVIESYWNHSRLQQIFGRADRFCSHKSLPPRDRTVRIFIYAAVAKKAKASAPTPESSIDLFMLKMADEKRDSAEPYVAALQHCAVDRLLNTAPAAA